MAMANIINLIFILYPMICAANERSKFVGTKLVYQARSVLICSRYAARLRVSMITRG